MDILWTCVATIFLSIWSAICLNVPNVGDTIWTYLKRKIWMTVLSVMGPEFLLGYALGDWQSARETVTPFKHLRQDDKWTLKHGFFADVSGFVLRTSDDVSFSLNTKHILWLLEHHVMSPTHFETSFMLDSKTIDDRNKSDVFVRTLAVGQAIRFCVNIIARGVQGLAVTTLEITTVGIIIDSILVCYFWKDKPADVESTEVVEINMTLGEMLLLEEDEEARTRPYFRTPLDFANHEVWNFGLLYHYLINFSNGILPRSWRWRKKESLGRRSEIDVLPVTGFAMAIGFLAGVAFLGTNFIAWNFEFPTSIERLLWRISSCGLITVSVLAVPGAEVAFGPHKIRTMQEHVQKYRKKLEDSGTPGKTTRWKDRLVHKFRILAMKIRNNSAQSNPAHDVTLNFAITGMLILCVYFFLRAYILIEDIIAFRALPVKAYSTVDWWTFVPHVG